MSADLIFEDPPVVKIGRTAGETELGQWLAALRDHPGQWAKWPSPVVAATATFIRQGRRNGVAPGDYETRTVVIQGEASKRTMYARYVGGES